MAQIKVLKLLDAEELKKWDEASHPRANDGKFGSGGGGGKKDNPKWEAKERKGGAPDHMISGGDKSAHVRHTRAGEHIVTLHGGDNEGKQSKFATLDEAKTHAENHVYGENKVSRMAPEPAKQSKTSADHYAEAEEHRKKAVANVHSKNRFYTHMANHDKSMAAGKEAERAEGKVRDEKRVNEAMDRMEAVEPREIKEREEALASIRSKGDAKTAAEHIKNQDMELGDSFMVNGQKRYYTGIHGDYVLNTDHRPTQRDFDEPNLDSAAHFSDVKATGKHEGSYDEDDWKEEDGEIDKDDYDNTAWKKSESPLPYVDWELPG